MSLWKTGSIGISAVDQHEGITVFVKNKMYRKYTFTGILKIFLFLENFLILRIFSKKMPIF